MTQRSLPLILAGLGAAASLAACTPFGDSGQVAAASGKVLFLPAPYAPVRLLADGPWQQVLTDPNLARAYGVTVRREGVLIVPWDAVA